MTEDALSDGDRDRIADYLEKPAHERTVDDLVPADRDDASDAPGAADAGDATDAEVTGATETNSTDATDADAN